MCLSSVLGVGLVAELSVYGPVKVFVWLLNRGEERGKWGEELKDEGRRLQKGASPVEPEGGNQPLEGNGSLWLSVSGMRGLGQLGPQRCGMS